MESVASAKRPYGTGTAAEPTLYAGFACGYLAPTRSLPGSFYMQAKPIPQAILDAALSASAVESEVLNSERIEARFGSYGIDVISDRGGQRLASLYSGSGESRICRTFASVRRQARNGESIDAEQADIAAGRSIGARFRESGWSVAKRTLHAGAIPVGSLIAEVGRRMRLAGETRVAIHAYQLVLGRERQTIDYATIIEAHHPDYLTVDALPGLYRITEAADATIAPSEFNELLVLMGLAKAPPRDP